MCLGSWGHKDLDTTERLSSNSSDGQTASQGLRRERTRPPNQRPGFHPWVGKIPWRRKWQSTPDSCLENPMDRGAWWVSVRGLTKSWTR